MESAIFPWKADRQTSFDFHPSTLRLTALTLDNQVMMNIYLLLVLFNNCLVLSICIAFLILCKEHNDIAIILVPHPCYLSDE